jgi:hypothetical protein
MKARPMTRRRKELAKQRRREERPVPKPAAPSPAAEVGKALAALFGMTTPRGSSGG